MHHRSKTAQLETRNSREKSPRFQSCTPSDQGLYPQKNFQEFCCNPPKSRFEPRSSHPEQAHYRACTAPRAPACTSYTRGRGNTEPPRLTTATLMATTCRRTTVRSHAPRARANASAGRHTPAPAAIGAHSGTQRPACQCAPARGACQRAPRRGARTCKQVEHASAPRRGARPSAPA